ncbi:MAG TPA: LemA family protein [Chitinophagaceae bacterium]|nr:LemA family protein [Chitinophagaceae bacterium]
MKKGWIVLIVVLLILFIGGCSIKNTYNNLVTLDQNTKSMWGQVENQYQRRSDLIPNLVATVQGAANFETKTLTQVIQARASASQIKVDANDLSPQKIQQFQAAQGQLSMALGRLMVVSERYPVLQANRNFLDLQAQLEGTENRITVARQDFNNAVQGYNTQVKSFPTNIFASMFNYHAKGYFQARSGAQNPPQVKFPGS